VVCVGALQLAELAGDGRQGCGERDAVGPVEAQGATGAAFDRVAAFVEEAVVVGAEAEQV
jgi:hypothetical protein